MKHIFSKEKGDDHDFWMSYTDLMSGFLVIFMIATVVYYISNKDYLDALGSLSPSEAKSMIDDFKAKGNMVNINKDFKDVFKGINGIEFTDDGIGSIRFYPDGSSQMFEKDAAIMLPNLRNRIGLIGRPFVRQAMKLKNVDKKNILEIRIEGHADSDGDFMSNLTLSSRRAFAVYQCIHDSCGLSPEEKKFVEDFMISVGYSSAKPIKGYNGREIKDKSRRIEFKIISK